MNIPTKYQTPDINYSTYISNNIITLSIILPFDIPIDKIDAIKINLHNVCQTVLNKIE